jgi:formylglycine-generating enzyme
LPSHDMTEATNPGNNANYYSISYSIGSPYYRTPVGEFELSDSPYGTFDQGGNVSEWTEAVTPGDPSMRFLRGGNFDGDLIGLHASTPGFAGPDAEIWYFGFRVASIPEPGTLLLGAMTSFGLLVRRRS